MPTWSSAAAFEREVAEFQRRLERETSKAAARDAARKGQQIAEQEASRDLGGDPMFSEWEVARLDTRVKEFATGAVIMPASRIAAGGWTVAEFGRNSAFGPAQLLSGRRQRVLKSGRLSTARGTRRRFNGQTRGKATASRAIERMENEFPPIAEREIRVTMRKHFDVT